MKSFFQGISWSLFFLALGYFCFWCFNPVNFPITSVKFVGERAHLTQDELREVIFSELGSGFFRLKVSTLQQQLLSLPWIRQVDIRKVWPDSLVISFKEHMPAARWNNAGLLSEAGTLFSPQDPLEAFTLLPQLQGPEGRYLLVWEQFLVMKKILQPLNVEIQKIVLAPRGAWHLQLSNGITVMLGTNDVLARLQRFVHAYEKQLCSQEQKVAYVDLRYTSGMAIGWKSA